MAATAALLRDNFHKLLAMACVIFVVNINQLWITTDGLHDMSRGGPNGLPSRTLDRFFTTVGHDDQHDGADRQSSSAAAATATTTADEAAEARTTSRQQPQHHYRTLPARNAKEVKLLPGDYIYYANRDASWDSSPIVIESHKLIFFTIPKVGCTVWKQLFRRMAGLPDWSSQDDTLGLPHNPATNGLVYLSDLDLERADHIMKSPEWTRAIMVRDPKQRLLSGFLDKSVRNYHQHIIDRCCPVDQSCVTDAQTVPGFLRLCRRCQDDHWRPQNDRVDAKFWPYVDVVMHVETAAPDAERLLRRIGAWEDYGARGWGKTGESAIFQREDGGEHANFVEWQVWKWYTPAIEQQVVQFYQQDYDHPLFQFNPTTCLTCTRSSSSSSATN